ncbi:hypothetical protein EMIT091MI3_20218 [Kosakonia quasisacchari]
MKYIHNFTRNNSLMFYLRSGNLNDRNGVANKMLYRKSITLDIFKKKCIKVTLFFTIIGPGLRIILPTI